jgi:hypothetical protein
MNHLDEMVIGQNHLLKRSILLLKAWMTYESSLLGSQLACMATYGMYILAVYIFNNYGKDKDGIMVIKTEMQFLRKFFNVFGSFDWDKYMVTVYGPVRIQNFYDRLRDEFNFDINALAISERAFFFGFYKQEESLEGLLATPADLKPLLDKYSALRLLSYS